MNENERAEYLRSVLKNQKENIQRNGNSLVNPSSNNYDFPEFSNYDNYETQPLNNPNNKGNIFERVNSSLQASFQLLFYLIKHQFLQQ